MSGQSLIWELTQVALSDWAFEFPYLRHLHIDMCLTHFSILDRDFEGCDKRQHCGKNWFCASCFSKFAKSTRASEIRVAQCIAVVAERLETVVWKDCYTFRRAFSRCDVVRRNGVVSVSKERDDKIQEERRAKAAFIHNFT